MGDYRESLTGAKLLSTPLDVIGEDVNFSIYTAVAQQVHASNIVIKRTDSMKRIGSGDRNKIATSNIDTDRSFFSNCFTKSLGIYRKRRDVDRQLEVPSD